MPIGRELKSLELPNGIEKAFSYYQDNWTWGFDEIYDGQTQIQFLVKLFDR